MCTKVATPGYDQLMYSFDTGGEGQTQVFDDVEPYFHYWHADGFTRPWLPFTASETPSTVSSARWKLIPGMVQNEAAADAYANTLNARAEDVFVRASYRPYVRQYRGLLWVKGFYEPHRTGARTVVPHFIQAISGEPFTLGCIYNNWTDKDTGITSRTFTIITTPPNKLLAEIHNEGQRMPLIIPPLQRRDWLQPLTDQQISDIMQPLPDGFLKAHPVSGLVYDRSKGINNNQPQAQEEVQMQKDLFS